MVGVLLSVAACGGGGNESWAQEATAPDSTRRGSLLERLQREDSAFFPEELLENDPSYRDSIVSLHDSLGLDAFEKVQNRHARSFRADLEIVNGLWAYNRVEGLVAAVGIRVEPIGRVGPQLRVWGGYATGSEDWRHYEELRWSAVENFDWELSWVASYGDRVLPYGSNRVFANGARALVGAADEQDYLRRRGGGTGLLLEHESSLNASLAYDAGRETSMRGGNDFSFFGDLIQFNAPIDEGIERAIVGRLGWGGLTGRRLRADVSHRVAGGGLAGDFAYNRTNVGVQWRRFVVGRHELFGEIQYARTGGTTPIQQVADVGGLSSVRGYRRRTLLGRSALAARLEYNVPYDIFGRTGVPGVRSLRLQLVPWADAGRVWDGNSDQWIHTLGLGVQYFLGPFGRASNLRLDVSFPAGPNRPDDVRFDLRFARSLL